MDLDLSAPSTRVANLTFIVGIGALGVRTVSELIRVVGTAEKEYQRTVACWPSDETGLVEVAERFLSNKSLDILEQMGYQIPGRAVGQPPRVSLAFVVDVDDPQAASQLARACQDLASRCEASRRSIFVLGKSPTSEIIRHEVVTARNWEWAVPVPKHDRVAGVRSDDDLVASVARLILFLASSSKEHSASTLLGSGSSVSGTKIKSVGGAFLDCELEELLDALSVPVAGMLLDRQFKDPKTFQPLAAFDDQRRTRIIAMVKPEALAHKLLAGTPFSLSVSQDGIWQVQLPPGVVTADLERVPQRRWVAVLLKLRDIFDFTKARRWREEIEKAESDLLTSIDETIQDDVAQLHRYPRGADRLLAWAEQARTNIEVQPDIAQIPQSDFDGAIDTLRQEIRDAPNPVPVWLRVALLAWLGAEAARHLGSYQFGSTFAWTAFGTVFLVAAILGYRIIERAHRRLYAALHGAQEALTARYEAQARDNLIVALGRVRSHVLAAMRAEVQRMEVQVNLTLARSAAMVHDFGSDPPTDLVHVERLIPVGLRSKLLASLNLPIAALQSSAAADGAFAPNPSDGADCIDRTISALQGFANKNLARRLSELSLLYLIDFRDQEEPGFSSRIIRDLDRRATYLGGRAPLRTTWHGPRDVLVRFHDQFVAQDPTAVEQPEDIAILGCLKVGAGVVLPEKESE